jgi:hypothetical protein
MLYFSLYLTIISFIVHLSAYIGIFFLREYYAVFGISYIIHGLIFIPFFAMCFQLFFGKNKVKIPTFFESFNPILIFRRYFPNTNYKIGFILIILMIYVIINFYFSIKSVAHGSPELIDGGYFLNINGELNQIEKGQYVEMRFNQLKAFSGHWIIFSVIPLIFYLDRKKSKQKNSDVNDL